MEERKKPTHRKHNKWHDYRSACIYHITLVVSGREPVLGRLEEYEEILPSTQHSKYPTGTAHQHFAHKARMQLSPLGMDIADCIRAIPRYGAMKGVDLQILAQQVMDTHLHFVLYVRKPMAKDTLGDLIRGFKTGCHRALMKALASPSDRMGAVRPKSARLMRDHALFEEDYDETILRRRGQLKRMIDYVHQNPYRKWLKRTNKDKFIPVRNIVIEGKNYDAIGNMMLLGLARKEVHVRRRFSDVERRDYMNECVIKARQNYALVSPFISEHEVAVRDYCLKEGHSVIQLQDNGFTDFTTCPGDLYEYCLNGQVLLLVPSEWPHIDKKGRCTRQECEMLNARAEEIAGEK